MQQQRRLHLQSWFSQLYRQSVSPLQALLAAVSKSLHPKPFGLSL
jgi:hypothetical protein